jgi:hypothetical protein
MEFGAEQVKKRLKSSEIEPDAESLPAFYQTTENGLTVAKHPTLGQLKGIRTGNLSIASGSPMPLVLTEGLPRFPTATQEASPKPKTDKKRYYWTYFYKLQMTYKSMTVVVMDFTDWPKRAKFLQDGGIIEQQSLSKSVQGISVKAVQKGTFFEVTVNVELLPSMSYFASRNPSSPAQITVQGTVELWASTSTIYVARGFSKLVCNLETTFAFFGGNPATRQRTGNLQPNQRWSNLIPGLPFLPLSDNNPIFLTSGTRLNAILCLFPAILENKPDVFLVGPVNYSNPNACRSN